MKNVFMKDTFREIKNSFGRFLSIFAIIALGCGFFSGIKVTMSDMQDSAADFFVDNNLMDLKLASTLGVKSDELSAIKRIDSVEGVMASYSKDVFCENKGENDIIKVMSYNDSFSKDDIDNMNHPVLIEGRMPEKAGECVVDDKFVKDDNYKIGNEITLISPSENERITDTLVTETYKIVGFVNSPLYIGYERDKTNIGTGTVKGYILVSETDFVSDYYSEMYITFKELDDPPFSNEYLNKLNNKKTEVINAFNESINLRYGDLVSDYNKEIDSAKESIITMESFINSDLQQLQEIKLSTEVKISELNEKIKKANDNNKTLLNAQITQAKSNLEQIDTMIYARTTEDTEVIEQFTAQLLDAKAQLQNAESSFAAVKSPKTYEFNRYSNADYGSFVGDSEKVDSVAKVFPVFFILVAALVCLTTMTRMVEEQRIQIGTYKALGYSPMKIMSKYLIYSLVASVFGSLIGTTIGLKVLPKIIYSCYKILYNIPSINAPFKLNYAIVCMLVSMACTGGAVVVACYKELLAQPSQIMRPKAPKKGKRVVLEKIPFIWNKLNFLGKVTVRNLLRYKKRFFMTVIGVAGCTALILTGLALKQSISAIIDLQFDKVYIYDGVIAANVEDYEFDESYNIISKNSDISQNLEAYQTSVEVNTENETQPVSIMVPKQPDKLNEFINLQERIGGKKLELDDSGVIVTEKLCKLLDVEVGDYIEINSIEYGKVKMKIQAITENYALHYIYITPNLYEQLFDEPNYNVCYFNMREGTDTEEFASELISNKQISAVTFLRGNSQSLRDSLNSLDAIIWVLIICAGVLAIVVLYNLANINITERVREIATIKVLGFYDLETSAYIFRENIISSLIGVLFGWIFGIFLHRFVVLTAEVDLVMFSRSVSWWAFVCSGLITMVFAIAVNIILHFKLKKIDMVESLKSIE